MDVPNRPEKYRLISSGKDPVTAGSPGRVNVLSGGEATHLRPARARYRFVSIHRLEHRQHVSGDLAAVWDFFATPRNLAAITPPHMSFTIVGDVPPAMYAGQLIEYRVGILPGISTRWLTEITQVRLHSYFVDEQRLGPYKLWHHEHAFAAGPDGGGVVMTDRVTYALGWGVFGAVAHALWVRRELERIFAYRAKAIAGLFGSQRRS